MGLSSSPDEQLPHAPCRDQRPVCFGNRRNATLPHSTGDLALVPHGQGHVVASAPGLVASKLFEIPREQVSERYETLRLGGDGERTTMICGLFQFDDPAAQQLITLLPEVITVDTWATPQAEWIRSTLRMIAAEAREMSPGGETVITRLADILVVHAIRYWITHSASTQTGWLGALHDRADWPGYLEDSPSPNSPVDA